MVRFILIVLIISSIVGCASNQNQQGYVSSDFRCTSVELKDLRKKLSNQVGLRELSAKVGTALPAYSDWLIGNHVFSMEEANKKVARYRGQVNEEISNLDALVEKLKSCPTSMQASYDIEIQALERKAHYQKFNNLLNVKEKFIRYANEDLAGWHELARAHSDALVYKNENVELHIDRWLYQREGMRRLIKVSFSVMPLDKNRSIKTVLDEPRKGYNRYTVAIEDDSGKTLHAEKISPRVDSSTVKDVAKGETAKIYGSFIDLTSLKTQSLSLVITDEFLQGVAPFKVSIPRSIFADARLKMPPLYERVSK